MEAYGRKQLFSYTDEMFNAHHSVSENYNDPFTDLHMHNMYEIYCFIDGDGEFSVEGNNYIMKPGTIMFLKPGEAHSVHITSPKRYERIAIHFNNNFINLIPGLYDLLESFKLTNGESVNCIYKNADTEYHLKLLRQMTESSNTESQNARLALLTTLPALIYSLAAGNYDNNGKYASDPIVRQIVRYIDLNLSEHWNLDDLSESLYRDKAYLNRRFKKIMGTGIWDYTIKKRIITIQQNIKNYTDADEAFKASGFGDYSTFFRNYIKITGSAPSEDIKNAKK